MNLVQFTGCASFSMMHLVVPLLTLGADANDNRRQMFFGGLDRPPPPAPMPPVYVPATDGTATFVITSGFQNCHVEWMMVNGQNISCVSDGTGPHGNYERCEFRAQGDLFATAIYYDIEAQYDYLEVNGQQYRDPYSPPRNVFMNEGELVTWYADASIVGGGFEICATASSMIFSPPSPLPPPPPSASPFPPGMAPPPFYRTLIDTPSPQGMIVDGGCGASNVIDSAAECLEAAQFIGLTNLTMTLDAGSSATTPPGCYTASDVLDCRESCYWASDGDCDDGGVGSEYTACDIGSDCTDCGSRAVCAALPPALRSALPPACAEPPVR